MKRCKCLVCLSLALFLALSLFAMTPVSHAANPSVPDGLKYSIDRKSNTVTITDYTGSAPILEIPSAIDGYPVTRIEDFAFNECADLSEIVIPDSVTSIGYSAFGYCRSLSKIVIPDSVTSIDEYAFFACTALSEIDISDSVTSIGNHAFTGCRSLTEIVIPDGVTYLGSYMFYGCYSLTEIVIPDSVTSIGNAAFKECTSLALITIQSDAPRIDSTAFSGCTKLTEFRFVGDAPNVDFKVLLKSLSMDYTVYYPAGNSSWDSIVSAKYNVKSVTWIPTCWGMQYFQKVNAYTTGMFGDVVPNSWYEANVARSYELGLMKGTGEAAFSPTKNITIAEVITMAARIHSIYMTGSAEFAQGAPWYQVYVDYAIENGIIGPNSYSNYTAPATRAMCAAILGAAVPESELQAINNITVIPDVTQDTGWGKAVYRLYNAGVLTGTDASGTFAPAKHITRAEVATIATRIVDASLRKSYSIP